MNLLEAHDRFARMSEGERRKAMPFDAYARLPDGERVDMWPVAAAAAARICGMLDGCASDSSLALAVWYGWGLVRAGAVSAERFEGLVYATARELVAIAREAGLCSAG